MTAEELAEAHRFVDVWKRAGYMSAAEAAAWRERIAVWQPRRGVADSRNVPRFPTSVGLIPEQCGIEHPALTNQSSAV